MTASRNPATSANCGAAGPVASPCNSVCRMDPAGAYCVGCFRTLDEIAGWSGFDDRRRRLIWEELLKRRAHAAQTTCGRPR